MEVCHEVPERRLDLILHSPGGFPQAAEQMLNYLRTQFDYIRALVPLQAKSAATMLALGADEIVMGRHSELGPIDPQIIVPVPEGSRPAPAHAILRDFQRAKDEIATDTGKLPAWTPILRGYAGGLIDFCSQQIALSQEVVAGWLEEHMLSHDDAGIPAGEREEVAKGIAGYFGSEDSYDRFRTHSRPIRVEELEGIRGLRVRRLEQDDDLQDAVLSIYHALDLTFSGPAIKIVENHVGARYVRIQHQIIVQGGPAVTPTPAVPPSKPKPQGNRAERRRQQRAR
ncbi:MAG: SDH family Clp fold serine proteinase [Actinomycetota bacterium]